MDRWIFLLKLRNRAGVLSALTAVFADRGVSIESLTAHAGSGHGTPDGTAILTFAAPEAKKDHLARLLTRHAAVRALTEYRYDDAEHARKSALARVALTADALIAGLPPGILCDIVSVAEGQTLALLLGPPQELDAALDALADRGALQETDSTVIVV
jgi:acetolactate synthase small subunit